MPRLAAMLFLIALLTSRLTLVLHEVIGHALPAVLVGARIEDLRLFWFAGGYVRFGYAAVPSLPEQLFVILGGIGLELVAGALALGLARGAAPGSVRQLSLFGFGAINLVHAGFYLAAGTFHGYGDGRLLHHHLGAARAYLCLALGVGLVAVTFFLARRLTGLLRGRLAGVARRWQLPVIAGAVALAAAGHAALTMTELAVRASPTYVATMQDQSAREVERELAAYRRSQEARGAAPTEVELQAVERALVAEHRQAPFRTILVLALIAAMGLGAWRSGAGEARAPAPAPPPAWRELAPLVGACAISLLAVIAVSAAL